MQTFIILSLGFAVVVSIRDYNFEHHQTSPIPILTNELQLGKHGSYRFHYETGHGIQVQEAGYVKNAGVKDEEIQVAEGSYSYTGADGHPVSVRYIADENGFQVQGDHLPTSPPISHEIAEAQANVHQYPDEEEQEQQQYQYQEEEEQHPQHDYHQSAQEQYY